MLVIDEYALIRTELSVQISLPNLKLVGFISGWRGRTCRLTRSTRSTCSQQLLMLCL